MKEFIIAKFLNIFYCEMDLENFESKILLNFKTRTSQTPISKKTCIPENMSTTYATLFSLVLAPSGLISYAHSTGSVHFWILMLKKKFDDLESQKSKF